VAQKLEAKEERPLQSYTLKDFLAVNTTNTRTATPDHAFYNLENAQPIGAANIHSINDISSQLQAYGVDLIYFDLSCNVANTEYLIQLSSTRKAFAYNVGANTLANITGGVTLDGTSGRIAQWQNTNVLVIDTGGYWQWNGSGTLTAITGTGAPTNGTAIAVYQNRVWIIQGRLLYYSAPGSFSDFTTASGGGFTNLIDPVLRSNVFMLHATNGYLYLVGISSVQALSDLYVPTGASPPTPNFTLLPLTGIVGSDQPFSIIDYGRLVLFANRYGIWSIVGTQVTSISSADPNNAYNSSIDGTLQYVDFSQGISAGQLTSNSLLCAGFLIKRLSDPVFGSNTVICMYQGNAAGGRWWTANYGAVTRITTSFKNGSPVLFGYIAGNLFQLFALSGSSPPANVQTGLWDFGDPITAKEVIKCGVGLSIFSSGTGAATLNVDIPNSSNAVPISLIGTVQWVNNLGNPVSWVNNASSPVTWVPGVYLTFYGAAPRGFAKYVGLTMMTPQGFQFELQSFLMDYKWAARWTGN
jgi:hypothetical protein